MTASETRSNLPPAAARSDAAVSSLAAWRAAGTFFDWHGSPIFFRAGGAPDAPALLLIHGFPTASWDWAALWPALGEQFRLIAPDLLGFGFSAKPPDHDYRFAEQADLCESLLAAQGVTAYHVLAHDYGDTVAQELLARQREPGRAAKLLSACYLNGGLFPEAHRPVLMQRLLPSLVGPLVARLSSRALLRRNFRRIFGPDTPPAESDIDAFWTLITHNHGRAALPRLSRYRRERVVQRARWVGAMQAASVPQKLIVGLADPIAGRAMADRYAELIPAADVTRLELIGHYPQVEDPAAVLAAYRRFVYAVASVQAR